MRNILLKLESLLETHVRLINTTPYVPHNIILTGFSSIFNLEEIPKKRKNSKNLINDFWF